MCFIKYIPVAGLICLELPMLPFSEKLPEVLQQSFGFLRWNRRILALRDIGLGENSFGGC